MRKPETIEKTLGWEDLARALESMTQTEAARQTGLKQSAISLIVNLRKKPNLREGLALEKLGVKAVRWTLPLPARRKGAA